MDERRRSIGWKGAGGLAASLVMAGMLAVAGAPVGLAQDATPRAGGQEAAVPRPAHIHAGDCTNLGEIVAPLNDLTQPTGDRVGQSRRAILAESSLTTVPLTLDQILAGDHAVNVHLSQAEIGTYIACGEIGGALDANGALVIGLRELNNSGFTGVAYLAPGADGASTVVSVFVAETGKTGGRGGARAAGTPAAGGPAATPTS